MVNKDFYAALEEICASKGIERQSFLDTLQNALISAYKKYAGDACDVVIKYNEEKCAIKFYAVKKIVEEVIDKDGNKGVAMDFEYYTDSIMIPVNIQYNSITKNYIYYFPWFNRAKEDKITINLWEPRIRGGY